MPSPFVHSVLPSSCLAIAKKSLGDIGKKEWHRLLAASVVLANFPDLDIFVSLAIPPHNMRLLHRSLGHNLFAAIGFTLVGGLIIRKWAAPSVAKKKAWLIATALVFSHLFLDSLGDRDPMTHLRAGIPLFWPFSSRSYHLPFSMFGTYELDSSSNQVMALLRSTSFWKNMFTRELAGTVIFLVLWAIIFNFPNLSQWKKKGTVEVPSPQTDPTPDEAEVA